MSVAYCVFTFLLQEIPSAQIIWQTAINAQQLHHANENTISLKVKWITGSPSAEYRSGVLHWTGCSQPLSDFLNCIESRLICLAITIWERSQILQSKKLLLPGRNRSAQIFLWHLVFEKRTSISALGSLLRTVVIRSVSSPFGYLFHIFLAILFLRDFLLLPTQTTFFWHYQRIMGRNGRVARAQENRRPMTH